MDDMSVSELPFVGRNDELDNLTAHYDSITGDSGWIDIISGEPGIGKSALTRAYEQRCVDAGRSVHTGRCTEGDATSYLPWTEIVRSVGRSVDLDTFVAEINVRFDSLDALVPGMLPREAVERAADLPKALESQPPKMLLFRAISELFRFAGASSPIVLILEDLHWADDATCELLGFVARAIERLPIHLVCTFRSTAIGARSSVSKILGSVLAVPQSDFVRLPGLGIEDIRSLLDITGNAGVGEDAGDRAVEILVQTDGNALLARALIETDSPEVIFGSKGLPERVANLIGMYIGELTEEEFEVVGYAAVLGEEYPISRLARVAEGKTASEITLSLESATKRGLLEPISPDEDRYKFRHELVRRSILDELGLSRRVEIHAACATGLEAMLEQNHDISAMELYHHFSRSEIVHGLDKSDNYALEAAREARENEDYEAMIQLLEPRIDAVAKRNPALGAPMYTHLAVAYSNSRGRRICLDALRSAFALVVESKDVDVVRNFVAKFGWPWPTWVDDETKELALQAIEILKANPRDGDLRDADERLIRRAETSINLLDLNAGGELGEEANRQTAESVETAIEAGEIEYAVSLINARMRIFFEGIRWEEQLGEMKIVRRLFAGKTDERFSMVLIGSELEAYLRLGRLDEAAELVARMEPVCSRHTEDPNAPLFLSSCLNWYVRNADWTSFERVFETTKVYFEKHPYVRDQAVLGLVELDRLDEARKLYLPSKPLISGLAVGLYAIFPTYFIRSGDLSITGMIDPPPSPEMLVGHGNVPVLDAALRGFSAWLSGDLETLRSAVRDSDFGGLRHEVAGFINCIAGNREAAREFYIKGLEHTKKNFPRHGWLMLRLATLTWNEDREQAEEMLERARDYAKKHDLRLLRRKIARFEATGDEYLIGNGDWKGSNGTRNRRNTNPAGLTDREIEVLQALSLGKTDAEIAETLFVSTKTASTHVGNILKKTNTANRTEAAKFADEHGLIS